MRNLSFFILTLFLSDYFDLTSGSQFESLGLLLWQSEADHWLVEAGQED